jgi:hypothetical protein
MLLYADCMPHDIEQSFERNGVESTGMDRDLRPRKRALISFA